MSRTASSAASNGAFGRWQPEYAKKGIATFPVNFVQKPDGKVNKVPAVRNYQRFGLKASKDIAERFADAPGIGFVAGPRSKLTVLDIDIADERVLADFLDRHGQTPIIARTASGKFHAWYRFNGEGRHVRAWGRDLPIDLLGGGVIVAPPSAFNDNAYTFIAGSLDDIDRLPAMRGLEQRLYKSNSRQEDQLPFVPDGVFDGKFDPLDTDCSLPAGRRNESNCRQEDQLLFVPDGVFDGKFDPLDTDCKVPAGRRNKTLFTHCLANAHRCENVDELVAIAIAFRDQRCELPASLQDDEVVKTAASAWTIHVEGRNRVGTNASWNRLVLETVSDPYLHTLLSYLQVKNRPGATFMVADGLAKSLEWPRRKLAEARRQAINRGYITMVRKPRQGNPALYRWAHYGKAQPKGEKPTGGGRERKQRAASVYRG